MGVRDSLIDREAIANLLMFTLHALAGTVVGQGYYVVSFGTTIRRHIIRNVIRRRSDGHVISANAGARASSHLPIYLGR